MSESDKTFKRGFVRNQAWANYVLDRRKARQLTRRVLAERCEMDPSYITLIERDGYVPKRDRVIKIAEVLECDCDHTLLVAGYAPEKMPIRDLLERIQGPATDWVLSRELRDELRELMRLPESQQQRMAQLIRAGRALLRVEVSAEPSEKKAG
jgi:transcriptional regulator with XRE-family HTH domain